MKKNKKLDEVKIFNTPNLKSYQKILLIDDIVDSGESLTQISKLLKQEFPQIKLKIATIFYKKSASFENERHAIGLDNGLIFFGT